MQDENQAESRLQSLHDLKGRDLVTALIRELGELHRQVHQLQREVSAYREYQAARDRWLMIDTVQKTRAQLPRTVTIDASQGLLPRQGFYGLEYSKAGAPFCWTGPSQNFSFDMFVDRTNGAEAELRALSCINFERQKDIKVFVNGETVPATVTRNGNGLIVRADLPATEDDCVSNIVFRVPEAMNPAGESGDKRLLGVAFQSVTVRARSEAKSEQPKAKPGDTVVALARPASKRSEEPAPPKAPTPAGDVAAS